MAVDQGEMLFHDTIFDKSKNFILCTAIQVNLFQKHLFLHQLIHNMRTDCSLNYEFSTRKIQVQNMLCTKIVFCFDIQNNFCTQHVLNLHFSYWTHDSMNNLLSYCGLSDSRMSASDTDLPVFAFSFSKLIMKRKKFFLHKNQATGIMLQNGRQVLQLLGH
jgi:hypothetical protein